MTINPTTYRADLAGHTPGPWHAEVRDGELNEWVVLDDEGVEICTSRNPYDGYDLAVSYARQSDCPLEPHARLLAAAPDLLTALRSARGIIESLDDGGGRADEIILVREQIRDAIAKATGKD